MEVVVRRGRVMTRELSAVEQWAAVTGESFKGLIERDLLEEALTEEL